MSIQIAGVPTIIPTTYALHITCKHEVAGDGANTSGEFIVDYGENGPMDCKTDVSEDVAVTLSGVGVGLEGDSLDFEISCPFVKEKRLLKLLKKKGAVRFYGPEMGAGAYVGFKEGLFVSSRGGFCNVIGSGGLTGVEMSIDQLRISTWAFADNGHK